jgi:glycosyltransferase involved in cell wall biosynthesis
MPIPIVHLVSSLDSDQARAAASLAARSPGDEFDARVVSLAGRGPTSLGRRWTVDPLAWRKLRALLKEVRPAIVHAWGVAALRYGATAVRSARSGSCVASLSGDRAGPPFAALNRRLARVVDRVIVPHESARSAGLARGVAAEKLVVIPPGVDPAAPPAITRDQLADRLGIARQSRLIGVAGPLLRCDRLKDVLWAAELVYVLHKNACLLVWGEGLLRGELERFARDVNAAGRVRFLGDDAPYGDWLGLLDVFWSGGDCDDAPFDLLDAMAAGLPVVASDTPAHRAVVVDGATGFLAPAGSRTGFARPTDQIFRDAQLARRLGEAGRDRADREFSLDAMVASHLDLYRQMHP